MKLTQLQKLAEGSSLEGPRRRYLDKIEDAINKVEGLVTADLLKNLLKDGDFPASESADLLHAAKKLSGEFEDFKMALLQEFDGLNEATGGMHTSAGIKAKQKRDATAKAREEKAAVTRSAEPTDELKTQEKIIKKILGSVEDDLPYAARYKNWEVLPNTKEVHWVTQESGPKESSEAARIIAKQIRVQGVKGWTVKVVLRDDFDGEKTKWHAKVKT